MAIAAHDTDLLGESMNTQIPHAWLQAWNTSSVKEAGARAAVLTAYVCQWCAPQFSMREAYHGVVPSGVTFPIPRSP